MLSGLIRAEIEMYSVKMTVYRLGTNSLVRDGDVGWNINAVTEDDSSGVSVILVAGRREKQDRGFRGKIKQSSRVCCSSALQNEYSPACW